MTSNLPIDTAIEMILEKPGELFLWQYYKKLTYKNFSPTHFWGVNKKTGLINLFDNKITDLSTPNIKCFCDVYSIKTMRSILRNCNWNVGTIDEIKARKQ